MHTFQEQFISGTYIRKNDFWHVLLMFVTTANSDS